MRRLLAFALLASPALGQKPAADLKHGVTVTALAFSPDGRYLASGGQDQTVKLWNLATGVPHELRGHAGSIASLNFSADGRRLASGSRDGSAVIWDAVNRKLLHRLTGHDRTVLGVSFSPDGRLLASASYDQTIRLWETATGKQLCEVEGHGDAVSCVAFSPDGRTLASGGHDAFVKVWSLAADGRSLRLMHTLREGRKAEVTGLGFCMGGKLMASVTPHGTIRLRDPLRGEELRFAGVEDVTVLTLACSADGRTLAVAGLGGAFGLCETATGQMVARKEEAATQTSYFAFTPTEGYAGEVRAVALSSTGLTAAVGTKGGLVLVRDVGRMLLGKSVPEKLAEKDLDRLWEELREQNPAIGYRAAALLMLRPDDAVPFLGKRLLPVAQPNDRQIDELIAQLDSPRFTQREKAAAELERIIETAESALRKRLQQQPALEMRRRIERLLSPLDERVPPPERLRTGRALQALEQIATPAARRVLEGLARGCPGSWLTEEAGLALRRMTSPVP